MRVDIAGSRVRGYGPWDFTPLTDLWDTQNPIRGFLKQAQEESTKEMARG